MNIRTMNAKLAELRAQNVEGTEVENRAEILAQIEEITEARNAAMAAADGIREAATPIQRTMDRRDASEEWRASPEYRDQWLSYLRGGRMPEQRAAMTTANPATNSVLIPKLYTDAMAHYASMATVARQLVDYKSGVQGYQTLRYNTLFSNDAITNAWTVSDVGTQASTEINPVFAEVPLAPAACLPFTTVSKQLLLQSNFDLEAEVVENLNRQFVRNAEWGLLSGGGSTGTNGSTLNQPTGLFTVQTGCTIATATSTGTSRALALTAACTVPNLTAMRYTSLPASYWGTASWLMGQDVYAKIAGLTINGVPVFVPSADAVGQAGAGFTLMGLPVFVSEFTGPTQATGAGAKNTIFSLGNHNEGYSAREWAGATIMRDDLSLAAAAQVKFQGTMFMNGNFTRAKAIVQMQVTNA
jgi:HK97 family phage major capsid protein